MIYIVTLIVCLFLVWKYDWHEDTRHKELWYYGLLTWFILLSGLQYFVGSDMEEYVIKYQMFDERFGIDMFARGLQDRQQPGWVFLTWFCKLFTDDFLLMKIIQATFLNVAVFSFFKRETKYLFLCIFFYAFMDYLVLNFNTLRQSFSLAFGLYAISYLKNNKYLHCGLFIALAVLFHNSATILLLMPLAKLFRSNNMTVYICFAVMAIGIYLLSRVDSAIVFNSIINSEVMGDENAFWAEFYLDDDRLGMQGGARISWHVLLVIVVVSYYIIRKENLFWGAFGMLYLFLLLSVSIAPILWRFRVYFDLPYFVMLAHAITEFPIKKFKYLKYTFYALALMVFMYFPMKDYFYHQPNDHFRYIDQYYPYHSIFDPKIEQRE